MYRLTSNLVIYRNFGEDQNILYSLAEICRKFYSGEYVKESLVTEIYTQVNNLLDAMVLTKICGIIIWHSCLQ